MKQRQINKIKVWVFEEKELREKLLLNDEQVELVLAYQDKFPELLQKDANKFCINARRLWKELGVKRRFGDWVKDKIKKYKFTESIDFTSFHKNVKAQSTYINTVEYYFNIDCAKELCMIQNNENGRMVRKYFILMENTLKDYEEWTNIRSSEKDGWNIMKNYIKEWCERKGFDSTLNAFYIREANLINVELLGYKASEVNSFLHNEDELTRNHLSTKINDAIENLQELNSSLLIADMDFEVRKSIINKTCESKYKDLKVKFQEIIE